jgi:hypothetical protein
MSFAPKQVLSFLVVGSNPAIGTMKRLLPLSVASLLFAGLIVVTPASSALAVENPTPWTQTDYPETGDPAAPGMSCASEHDNPTRVQPTLGNTVTTFCNFPVNDPWYNALDTSDPAVPVMNGPSPFTEFCMVALYTFKFSFKPGCANGAWGTATVFVKKGVADGLQDRQVSIAVTLVSNPNPGIWWNPSIGAAFYNGAGSINRQTYGGNVKSLSNNVWVMSQSQREAAFPASGHPVPLKSFGQSAAPAPVPCVSPGDVVFEVDGQTVAQVDEQGTTMTPNSANFAAMSLPTVDYGMRAIGDGLAYRTSAGTSWLAVGGGVVVGDNTLISWEPYIDGVRSLSNFEVRCKWDGVTKYWALSNLGDQVWSDSPGANRACKGISVLNGEGRFEVGDVVQLAYDFPAGDYLGTDEGLNGLEVFTGGNMSAEGDGGRQLIESAYSLYGSQIGGSEAPWSYLVPVDSKGTLRFVAAFSGDRASLFIGCFDSEGQQLVTGGGSTWNPYNPLGSNDPTGTIIVRPANWLSPSDCLPTANIGFNPTSWVPGVGSMFVCLAKTLVGPGQFNSAAWNAGIEDTNLNQWGAPVATFTSGLSDLATADGECDPTYAMPPPIPDLTLDMCSGPIAAARTISFTLSTLAIGLWVGRMSIRKMETFVSGQPQ